jgi:hypothetical protein
MKSQAILVHYRHRILLLYSSSVSGKAVATTDTLLHNTDSSYAHDNQSTVFKTDNVSVSVEQDENNSYGASTGYCIRDVAADIYHNNGQITMEEFNSNNDSDMFLTQTDNKPVTETNHNKEHIAVDELMSNDDSDMFLTQTENKPYDAQFCQEADAMAEVAREHLADINHNKEHIAVDELNSYDDSDMILSQAENKPDGMVDVAHDQVADINHNNGLITMEELNFNGDGDMILTQAEISPCGARTCQEADAIAEVTREHDKVIQVMPSSELDSNNDSKVILCQAEIFSGGFQDVTESYNPTDTCSTHAFEECPIDSQFATNGSREMILTQAIIKGSGVESCNEDAMVTDISHGLDKSNEKVAGEHIGTNDYSSGRCPSTGTYLPLLTQAGGYSDDEADLSQHSFIPCTQVGQHDTFFGEDEHSRDLGF